MGLRATPDESTVAIDNSSLYRIPYCFEQVKHPPDPPAKGHLHDAFRVRPLRSVLPRPSMYSKSRFHPGVSPTPAPASASSCSPVRLPHSERNSPTPERCNKLTGVTPTLALHVLWDLPDGVADAEAVRQLESRHGVAAGSINPNLFRTRSTNSVRSAIHRLPFASAPSSICSIRSRSHRAGVARHLALAAGRVKLPGTQNMRKRIEWLEAALSAPIRPGARPAAAHGIQTL